MIPVTDLATTLILLFSFANGWAKGFIRSLLGPIALAVSCLIAYFIFNLNGNILICLLITILGPFVIYMSIAILLRIWNKATKNDEAVFTFGRMLGGIINFSWSAVVLALIYVSILFIPGQFQVIKKIQNDVFRSQSYRIIRSLGKDLVPQSPSQSLEHISAVITTPEGRKAFEGTTEYQNLMANANVQNLVNDPKIQKAMADKDFKTLFLNSNIREILKNPRLVKQFVSLHHKLIEQTSGPTSNTSSSGPRTVYVEKKN